MACFFRGEDVKFTVKGACGLGERVAGRELQAPRGVGSKDRYSLAVMCVAKGLA